MRKWNVSVQQVTLIHFYYFKEPSKYDDNYYAQKNLDHFCTSEHRRMAENGFAPPPWEFSRHILSC